MQQSGLGNIDWMSLAAKMFLTKMNDQTSAPKQRTVKPTSSLPSHMRARSPGFKPRMAAPPPFAPPYLHPDCVATIKQFEALRTQLLRQLVVYQTQLLALKMPFTPCQLMEPRPKTTLRGKAGCNKSKKPNPPKKVKCEECNQAKKWEKSPAPAHALKTPSKRRSLVHQKPKKSSKKASKRKLENIETSMSMSNSCDNNVNNQHKKPCQPYHSYMGGYSSSTESVYSTKHLNSKNDTSLESVSGKDFTHQNSCNLNTSNVNEGKNNPFVPKFPKKKLSKMNKKISSAFNFGTATDETHSSQ